ncbi:MAG: PfkB family carbohydrate kinase [Candidatus Kariarchaeaceae archaeon]|jgi:fructoselysine 6-kinase
MSNSSIACVGHNTVDKYVNFGMMYPGGNEVNVAVQTSRHGLSSSYLGWVGNDVYGNILLGALESEGVDITHCFVKDDVTTFTEIYHEDGERRFGNVRRGASTRSILSEYDLEFILNHNVLHTSYYSRMEQFISDHAQDMMISFDFTELADEKYLTDNLPFVDIAILPQEDNNDIKSVMKRYHKMGAKIILFTMGSKGSYAYDGKLYYQPAIVADKIVDSLGAGDSFIARFMVEYLRDTPIEEAMIRATESAYETCMHYGAFGHGVPIPSE